jgi:hypothetical protein
MASPAKIRCRRLRNDSPMRTSHPQENVSPMRTTHPPSQTQRCTKRLQDLCRKVQKTHAQKVSLGKWRGVICSYQFARQPSVSRLPPPASRLSPPTSPSELGRVVSQYEMLAFIRYNQLHRVDPVDQRTINAFMHWPDFVSFEWRIKDLIFIQQPPSCNNV